jgi:UDP-glucose 4-epimerase
VSVLVTGAGGFLGAALLRAVDGIPAPRADLADAAQVDRLIAGLEGVDAVVHCAAATPFNGGDLAVNDAITRNVTRLCNELGVARLLFASGWVVYAVDRVPVREDDRLAPATPYGASKLVSERFFAAELERTALVNVRLASVYGPGQLSPGLIPNLVTAGLATGELRVAAASTRRDYVHVDDAAEAFRRLLAVPVDRRLDVNVGAGASASVLEVARAIAAAVGEHATVAVDDPPREASPPDNVLDVSRARALGVLAEPRPLRAGLADYVAWRRSL